MGNDSIKTLIVDYANKKDTDYALLINGKWGTGKTYFLKNELKKVVEKKAEKKFVYVSLNGVKSEEEIMTQILLAKYSYLKKLDKYIPAKLLLEVAKYPADLKFPGASKLIDSFGSVFSRKNLKVENVLSFKDVIICLDDLERKSDKYSIHELLGFVNTTFIEHKKIKLLFIGDESKINESERQAYSNIKEKLIGRVINFQLDLPKVLHNIINTRYENGFREFLLKHENFILKILNDINEVNLRTIVFFLDNFEKIYNALSDEFIKNEEIIKSLITFTLVISVEFKTGNISSTHIDKDNIPSHFMSYSPTSYTVNINELIPIEGFEQQQQQQPVNSEKIFEEKYFPHLSKHYRFFESIYLLIAGGLLDVKKLIEEINKYEEDKIKKSTLEWNECLEDLYHFQEISNDRFEKAQDNVKKYLQEGKYSIYDLATIANRYMFFIDRKICTVFGSHQEVIDYALEHFDKCLKISFEWYGSYKLNQHLHGLTNSYLNKYQNNRKFNELITKIEKAHNDFDRKSNKDELHNLFDKFKIDSGSLDLRDLVKVINYIDISEWKIFLNKIKNRNIPLRDLSLVFSKIGSSNYHDSNLEQLMLIYDEFKTIYTENVISGVSKYHFDNIIDTLEKKISYLKKERKEENLPFE